MGYGDRIRTVEGINYSMVGFLMALFGSALGAVGTWITVSAATSDPFNNPFGPFGAGVALTCVSGLLTFLAGILYLIGFSHVHGGRFEFGPEQDKWASRALWAFVMTVILGITSAGVGGALALMLFGGGFIGQFPDPGTVATVFLVTAILGAMTQLCIALTILFPVRSLLKAEHSPLLALVTLLFILGPVAGNAINLATFDPSFAANPLGILGVGGGIGTVLNQVMSAVALGLSLLVYMMAKKRISSGEVQVQLRPMTVTPYYPMVQAYPMYPSYPPQYPAMYPPQYPAAYPPPQYPQSFPPPPQYPPSPQQYPVAPPAAVNPIPDQPISVPATPAAEPAKIEDPKGKKPPEAPA